MVTLKQQLIMQADQAGFVQFLNKRCDNWSYDNFPIVTLILLLSERRKLQQYICTLSVDEDDCKCFIQVFCLFNFQKKF